MLEEESRAEDSKTPCDTVVAPRPGACVDEIGEKRTRAFDLHESEGRYRALYDNIPLIVFQLDREGDVLSVNEHGARELGYTSDELVGRSVLRVFHPEDRQVAERQLEWALDLPHEVSRWELRKVRKDGTVIWVRELLRVVHAADGVPEVLMVCEDVTARRRVTEYQDRLRELNMELLHVEEREQQRMARVLHDELGQTLAAARMTISGLRDSEVCVERTRRLEELGGHLDRSIEVTRSLTFQLSPPILHDLGLAAAVQALGEQAERDHGLRFVFTLGEGWSPPSADVGVALYRMVRELLHNIIKHARAGRVRLELSGTREGIRIALDDDGVGFDVGAAPAAAGSGLGLFDVRARMKRLGGSFEIDSTLGRGTRAVLSLPVAQRHEPAWQAGRRLA